MTPDASRLPSEKEWGHSVCLVVHDPNTYTACDRCREAGAAIAAMVRALVRAERERWWHTPHCDAFVEMHTKCTCGYDDALHADEEAPHG